MGITYSSYTDCKCQALNDRTLYCTCGYDEYKANPETIKSRDLMLKQIKKGGMNLKRPPLTHHHRPMRKNRNKRG